MFQGFTLISFSSFFQLFVRDFARLRALENSRTQSKIKITSFMSHLKKNSKNFVRKMFFDEFSKNGSYNRTVPNFQSMRIKLLQNIQTSLTTEKVQKLRFE